jgi:hypothetical protein
MYNSKTTTMRLNSIFSGLFIFLSTYFSLLWSYDIAAKPESFALLNSTLNDTLAEDAPSIDFGESLKNMNLEQLSTLSGSLPELPKATSASSDFQFYGAYYLTFDVIQKKWLLMDNIIAYEKFLHTILQKDYNSKGELLKSVTKCTIQSAGTMVIGGVSGLMVICGENGDAHFFSEEGDYNFVTVVAHDGSNPRKYASKKF